MRHFWHQWGRNMILFGIGLGATVLSVVCLALLLSGVHYLGLLTLIQPFIGFTFTDREDFYGLALIGAVVPALAIRHFLRPQPRWWFPAAQVGAFASAVLAPAVYGGSLVCLYRYATVALGHAPRCMSEDPKYLLPSDATYQRLSHGVNYGQSISGALLWISFAFTLHLVISRRMPMRMFALLCAATIVAWLPFLIDPLHIYAWWMD